MQNARMLHVCIFCHPVQAQCLLCCIYLYGVGIARVHGGQVRTGRPGFIEEPFVPSLVMSNPPPQYLCTVGVLSGVGLGTSP